MTKRAGPGGTEPLPFAVESRLPGEVEKAVGRTLQLAREDDKLEDLDAAAAQLALAAAQAVDLAIAARDPYAFSQPARELRETLAQLRLDPTSRGAGTSRDPFTEWLDGLGSDDGTGAAVRDASDTRPA